MQTMFVQIEQKNYQQLRHYPASTVNSEPMKQALVTNSISNVDSVQMVRYSTVSWIDVYQMLHGTNVNNQLNKALNREILLWDWHAL